MARIPVGADLIDNAVSKAPGFQLGNVIVMAGVPSVMHAMLDSVAPTLQVGARILSETLDAVGLPEGAYAAPLSAIAAAHAPGISIGSYPAFKDGVFNNHIVVRGRDAAAVAAATTAVRAMIEELGAGRVA